nr:MAG TPA: NUMOD1 domain protein [Caudoviricetes sp.]
MQYYMLEKRDISNVRGIVDAKDVMRELDITNAQFTKMVRNEEAYKGCILVPIDLGEDKRKPTSEDDEQFQLIGESKTGIRYYITSYLRVVSVDLKGNQKEMKAKKETDSIYRVAVNFKEGRRYLNVLFEAYKAFVGEIEKNDSVVWDGEMKIENLRVIKLAQTQGLRNKKKVRIGDTVYSSISECARKNFISRSHMYQMIEGIRPNSIGVEFV